MEMTIRVRIDWLTPGLTAALVMLMWRLHYSNGDRHDEVNKICAAAWVIHQTGQGMANLASELGEKCTESDLKKSQICPIWGQSDSIWMPNLTWLIISSRTERRGVKRYHFGIIMRNSHTIRQLHKIRLSIMISNNLLCMCSCTYLHIYIYTQQKHDTNCGIKFHKNSKLCQI